VLKVPGVSPLDYALTQPGVILQYLKLCFWPLGQCLDYDWPVARDVEQYELPLVAVVCLIVLTVWYIFRWPRWGFLAGTFFLILAPTSSVAPITDMIFEHRMYLPLAAVVTMTVVAAYEAAEWLVRRLSLAAMGRRALLAVLLAGSAGVLGVLTYLRNEAYASKVAIWTDTADKAPKKVRVHHNLGVALLLAGRIEEAFQQFDITIELRFGKQPRTPDAMKIMCNLAWIRATSPDAARRNGPEAVRRAERACRLSREIHLGQPECLDTLAAAYAEAGQFNNAVATAEKSIELALKQHKPKVAAETRERLALYRAGRPFREGSSAHDTEILST
jgi:hypothetical protein